MVSTRSVRAGRAYVEVYSDDSKLTQGLARAHNKLVDFGNTVSAIGKGMMKAGLVTALPYALSTKIFKGFSDTMVSVRAVVGATADEYDMLVDKAKLLGRTTSFTAEQVAAGMLELGRAGFDPTEIDNAIAAVLNLARATGTELPEATGFAGATLRSFGLESSEMVRVADVLTAAVNNSAQTLTDMGEAMKYTAPVAAEFGMSLEDAAKSIGILANFGIKGSQAGTTLRTVMLQLADSTVRSQIEKLGVAVANQAGQFRNLADILNDIGMATSKLSNIERLSILKDLFQKRGVAGGAKLTAESFEKLDNAIDNAAGTAQRTAKIMDSEIGGAIRRLLSAAEGMAIALGKSVAEPLSRMAALLTVVSGKVSTFIERHETLTRIVGGLGVGLITTGAALFTFGKIIKLITFGIKTAVTVTRNLIATQAVLKAMSGPAGWAALAVGIGAAAAALISIDTIIDSHINSLDSAEMSAESFADAQKRIGDVSKESAAAVRSMTKAMNEKKDWSPIQSLGVKADEMDMDEFEVAELRLKKADNWNTQTKDHLALYKKVIQEKQAQLDLEKEAQLVIADNLTPQQTYNAEVKKLDTLLDKKLLTEKQYNRALAQQQKELQERSITPEQQAQQDFAKDLIEDIRTPAEEFKKRMAEIIAIFQKGLIDESTYRKAGQNLRRELFADADWFQFDDQIAKETDQLDQLKQKGLISESAYTRGRDELDKRGGQTDQLKKIEQYQKQMQALQGLLDSGLLRKGEFTKAERDLRKELGIKDQFAAQKSIDLAGVTTTGTFSSMALGGLSAGSVTDRIADSTEEVAKNTKQILRKMAEGQNFL